MTHTPTHPPAHNPPNQRQKRVGKKSEEKKGVRGPVNKEDHPEPIEKQKARKARGEGRVQEPEGKKQGRVSKKKRAIERRNIKEGGGERIQCRPEKR